MFKIKVYMNTIVKSYELLKSDYDNKLAMLVKMTKLNTELQNENRLLKRSLNNIHKETHGHTTAV